MNQWEGGDSFLRSEFNEDNRKTDSALAGKIGAVFGFYTGDGAETRVIQLGFRPKAVHMEDVYGNRASSGSFLVGGLTVDGMQTKNIKIVDNGFQVTLTRDLITNAAGREYAYIAYR